MSPHQLRVQPLAGDDLTQAYEWYETQQSGLGSELLDEMDQCFQRILANPLAFRSSASRSGALLYTGFHTVSTSQSRNVRS